MAPVGTEHSSSILLSPRDLLPFLQSRPGLSVWPASEKARPENDAQTHAKTLQVSQRTFEFECTVGSSLDTVCVFWCVCVCDCTCSVDEIGRAHV